MTTKLDQVLLEHIKELLQPLLGLSHGEVLQDLFDAVSWDAAALGITDPAAFTGAVQQLSDAVDSLDTLIQKDDIRIVEIAESLAPLAAAVVEIRNLISSLQLPPGSPADTLAALGKDILDFPIAYYLASRHPKLSLVLQFLGIFSVVEIPEIKDNNGHVLRASTQRRRLDIGAISQAVSDPLAYIRQRYLTDGGGNQRLADAIADLIGPELAFGLRQTGLTAGYGYVSADLTPDETESAKRILIVDAPVPTGDDNAPALLRLALALSDEANGLGVVAAFSDNIAVNISTPDGHITGELSGALEPLLITRDSVTFASAGIGGAVQLKASVGFQTDPAAAPALRFGSADSTHFEIGELQTGVNLSSNSQGVDGSGSIKLKEMLLAIQGGDGDGFLRSVLPADGLQARFDVGIVWSNKNGLTFEGGTGLDVTLPVGIAIGGTLTIPTVHLSLQANDAALVAEVSASIGFSIGPVHALVDRVGIASAMTFPQDGGNLGGLDLAFGFKPPSGIGVAIDTGGVSGGGFLDHDDTKQEYAGLLQLDFRSYKLTAFGLLATILPTGPGYSLIAMVDAEFPPIQLGFGLTLDGAGGLFGAHRIASVAALRAGLAEHTLSNLLFPKNPIANAPQLLTELDTLFPPAPGRFIFGPIVRIEWGEAALLTLELALVLELPAPVRLVLIAEVTVLLPTPNEKLIEIHLSALGTCDFGTSEGALDAVLHDSRLMGFTLHGAMALRVNWAGRKTFLLAVGGVHPKFQLPPGFPKLDRVGISMPSGNITTLNLDGYLAVSSNTLQIGAHVNIYVGVDDFGISGYLNFDTLIQRHPFHFDGDISGGVALSFEGDDIMALNLAGSLIGPAPWHAAGSVSFDFCWCTVTKSFSHTFGDSAEVIALGQVDVGQLLRAALGDARNFAALFAPDIPALVTLTRPVSAAAVVLAHPSTRLSVHQTVVPLGLAITQYGGSVPLGDTRFDITSVSVDGIAQTQPLASVLDDFAPAQFLTLSDDDKLASPSFERFAAGVEFDGTTIFGAPMTRAVDYETWLVDTADGPMREESGVPAPLPLSVLAGVLVEGLAGRGRFAGPHRVVMPRDLAFVVATSDQLTASDVGASMGSSYTQARGALDAELALHPERSGSLLVAAHYEVAA